MSDEIRAKSLAGRTTSPLEETNTGPHESGGSRQYLISFEGTSTSLFPLQPGAEVLVGRSPTAQLRLAEGSVSREHARIRVSGIDAFIVDLGSQNGTRVNGQRLTEPQRLISSDVISLGNVTLVYHSSGAALAPRSVLGYPALRERLEEELARTLRYGHPFAVVTLVLGEMGGPPEAAAKLAKGQLRQLDIIGWSTHNQLVVLLPESGQAAAAETAERLLPAVLGLAPEARAGVAACPVDGCEVDALLSASRAAAQGSREKRLAVAGEDQLFIDLGDRRVLVADEATRRLYSLAQRIGATDLPVLVCGETGTGKELAARALHHFSKRREGPMVCLNCAAIPDNLLESELFGYEKGAFSGAGGAKQGQIEAAHGGTIFLDEVGELPLVAQGKLLRVLEEKRVTRLGSVREQEVDVRIVAATNRNLKSAAAAGRFRADLFFRLSGGTLWLPPLRDRPRELPLLAKHFLKLACERAGVPTKQLPLPSMNVLMTYRWPGNVRELRNVMEFLAAAVESEIIGVDEVRMRLEQESMDAPVEASAEAEFDSRADSRPPPPVPDEGGHTGTAAYTGNEADQVDTSVMSVPASEPPTGPWSSPVPEPRVAENEGQPLSSVARDFRPIEEELRELERARMEQALRATKGNQRRAAELIGMPLRTFAAKLVRYGLEKRRGREG